MNGIYDMSEPRLFETVLKMRELTSMLDSLPKTVGTQELVSDFANMITTKYGKILSISNETALPIALPVRCIAELTTSVLPKTEETSAKNQPNQDNEFVSKPKYVSATRVRGKNTFIGQDGKVQTEEYITELNTRPKRSFNKVKTADNSPYKYGDYGCIKLGGLGQKPIPKPPLHDAKNIHITLQQDNPKKKNTKAWLRYEQYKSATNLYEYFQYAITNDYKADWHLGYLKINQESLWY